MKILKFGGSVIKDPEAILNVINIINDSRKECDIAVVLSALSGVTDKLILTADKASMGNGEYRQMLEEIHDQHVVTIGKLFQDGGSPQLEWIGAMVNELSQILYGIFLIKEVSPRTMDYVISFGERLSTYIICEALNNRGKPSNERDAEPNLGRRQGVLNYPRKNEYLGDKESNMLKVAEYLDARVLIKTDNSFNSALVNFELTNNNIVKYFETRKAIQCITGFIGSTVNNETTTLGRGGSDYTASLFAAALRAETVEIWKDVDGVMTADPKIAKKAFLVKRMTYNEAIELSHFGAKVIHPYTMQPVLDKEIPIRIRNVFNFKEEGTLITNQRGSSDYIVRGIASIENVALLTLQGTGMVGVAGVAGRLFGALSKKNISVILISQASSEHSICFAVESRCAIEAKKFIDDEFSLERKSRMVDELIVEHDLSIIAVVGENMKNTPGVAGRLFQALAKNGINVTAIAQGSSELNISIVVNKRDEVKAINSIHDIFFLSSTRTVYVFLVGTGLIGSTLLKQIDNQRRFLRESYSIEINVAAIANSSHMLFDENGIDPGNWEEGLKGNSEAMDFLKYFGKMRTLNLPNSLFVDCTASDKTINLYEDILKSSISIVTPNKRACSGPLDRYIKLKKAAYKNGVKFLYETNVGGGLPIISTLQDLFFSGDKILKIEAILSGTLSYIFNNFTQDAIFSRTVERARELGYTEPDPRDDLYGLDFARKLLILARDAGFMLELSDIKVQNILPEECRNAHDVEDFFVKLEKNDSLFEKQKKAAEKSGKVLRFIGTLENGRAEISLTAVDKEHPFFATRGSDNIISFTTTRYYERPLVIRGPGAGAEVTAAGVFADIINVANYLA